MSYGASNSPHVGLKAAALFEALKGLLVIVAGLGLLAFAHHDIRAFIERLALHLHLNPARHYSQYPHYLGIFIKAARRLTDARLWLLATGAFAYSALRFVEAYGLWRARAWGQWIGIVSGAIYLPVEVIALVRGPSALKAILLFLNALLVAYLSVTRYRQSRELKTRIQSN
ncbi:MAG: DUF2127 domain-containing protein [Blastocatellia bacterium]|nr:DUF2127 domain-containing protein [Blastocatellia bacterium]